MAENLSGDAIPFSFPSSNQSESAPPPPPPSPDKEKIGKKKKKHIPEDSSSSSDSDFDDVFKRNKAGASTIINIEHAKDVQIGNRYMYSRTMNYSTQNQYSPNDYDTNNTTNTDELGPEPSEELCNSRREINDKDMYIVAENISRQWMKLARFLPPKGSFSDGQLKTFVENYPHNLEESIIQMLKTWKQRFPENATIGNLVTTLWEIGKRDISQKLKP